MTHINQLQVRRVQSLPGTLQPDTHYFVQVDAENCDQYVTDNADPPNAYFVSRGPAGTAGALDDITDVTVSDPQIGDVLRKSAGDWINHNASGWAAVAVVSNEAVIDINDGDKFLLTVDDDCELQVPANAVPGAPFAVRVVMDGAHLFTYAAGWRGENPPVLTGNGDETVLAGIVLDTDPTTAIINIVKAIPAT